MSWGGRQYRGISFKGVIGSQFVADRRGNLFQRRIGNNLVSGWKKVNRFTANRLNYGRFGK